MRAVVRGLATNGLGQGPGRGMGVRAVGGSCDGLSTFLARISPRETHMYGGQGPRGISAMPRATAYSALDAGTGLGRRYWPTSINDGGPRPGAGERQGFRGKGGAADELGPHWSSRYAERNSAVRQSTAQGQFTDISNK